MKDLIQKNIVKKAYRRADNIIRYLTAKDDETVELSATEKKTLDRCKEIHGYRLRFSRKEDVIAIIRRIHGITERQARNLIHETEEIFGTVSRVNKEYERTFLLEASRKNIEIAMASRSSTVITKALKAHAEIAGLDEHVPDMPDFEKLEPHTYQIVMPENALEFLQNIMNGGLVDLKKHFPPPKLEDVEEAKEVRDGDKPE